jgi:hypothetical protein
MTTWSGIRISGNRAESRRLIGCHQGRFRGKAENTVQGRVEILIQESLERFPILVRRNVQFMKTVKHTNPCVEIVFTHEGRAAFLSRGKLLLQKRRQVLIHNAEVPHQFIALADKSYRCTALYVDRRLTGTPIVCLDWLNQIDVCQLDLETMSYSQLMEYCRNLEELSRDKKKGWRELAIAQLMQTSVRMEHIHAQYEEQFAGVRREEISSLVQQCVEYVYDHLEEKLSLVEMAAKFSISREHLTRSFTKLLHRSGSCRLGYPLLHTMASPTARPYKGMKQLIFGTRFYRATS